MLTCSYIRTGDAPPGALLMKQAPELQEICTQLATNYFKSDTHTENVADGEEHHKQYTVDLSDERVTSVSNQNHFLHSALTSKRMSMQYSSSSKDSMTMSYNVSNAREREGKKATAGLAVKEEAPNLSLSDLLGDLNTILSHRSKERTNIDKGNHPIFR